MESASPRPQVEERNEWHDGVIAAQPCRGVEQAQLVDDAHRSQHNLSVRVHDPLRHPCGSGRVKYRVSIILMNLASSTWVLLLVKQTLKIHPTGAIEHDQPFLGQPRFVCKGCEVSGCKKEAATTVSYCVYHLLGRKPYIDRIDHGPFHGCGVKQFNEPQVVPFSHSDYVPLLYAQF